MRIDIVTIFPEFFGVLDISLLGRARQSGLIELGVHDLRPARQAKNITIGAAAAALGLAPVTISVSRELSV